MFVMDSLISRVSNEFLTKKYPTRGSFEVRGKTVKIPAIYKGKGLTAVFPIAYDKATELIHSKDLRPARLSLTKALLSITVFDFSESPIGPYTELAYAIPVLYKSKFNIPLLPVLFNNSWKGLGYYVLDILQSTKIAIEHGNMLTEYPHNNNLINVRFEKKERKLKVNVSDEFGDVIGVDSEINQHGENIFRTYITYFEKDGDIHKIKMDIYGDEIKVNKGELRIGTSKLADLARLALSKRPLQASYYPYVIEINPVNKEQL